MLKSKQFWPFCGPKKGKTISFKWKGGIFNLEKILIFKVTVIFGKWKLCQVCAAKSVLVDHSQAWLFLGTKLIKVQYTCLAAILVLKNCNVLCHSTLVCNLPPTWQIKSEMRFFIFFLIHLSLYFLVLQNFCVKEIDRWNL